MSIDNQTQSPSPSPKGREIRITLVLLLLLGAGAFYVRSRSKEEKILTTEERYQADARIVDLLYECTFGKTFDADTSDLLPVMVSKLERGGLDPLRAFTQELGAIGKPAVPLLQRLFDDCYGDPNKTGVLTNILSVCALMADDSGLELGVLGLEHPRNSVRLAALTAVANHGDEHNYDLVKGWLPLAATVRDMGKFLQALDRLDRSRFQIEFVEILEAGTYRDAWLRVAPALATAEQPDIVQRYWELSQTLQHAGEVVPYLAAPAARDGDQVALEFLRKRLTAERDTRVQFTLQALNQINLGKEAGPVLLKDERASVRLLAAVILSQAEQDEEVRGWLQQGLSDPDASVRDACLAGLVSLGDKFAESQLLSLLTGGSFELSRAIKVLHSRHTYGVSPSLEETSSLIGNRDAIGPDLNEAESSWIGSPELAERVFEILTAEYAQSPDRTTRLELLKALGRVPLAEAAEFLLDAASTLGDRIGSLDSLRWCAGQAYNTGVQGHVVLRERLAQTEDPISRLHLIEFIWQDHSRASRELLLGLLHDPKTSPYEQLYIAGRLTRMRASTAVAPSIKRAYLACTDRHVRSALQCLLWEWYGQHDSQR